MNIKNQKKISLFMMLFFLLPSPNVKIGSILKIFSLSSLSLSLLLKNYKASNFKLTEIYNKLIGLPLEFKLLFIYIVYEVILFLFQPFSMSNLLYTYRSVYLFLISLFSIKIFTKYEEQEKIQLVLRTIYFILFVQYFISVLQLFDVNIFSPIYIDNKSFPLGRLVRLTGTMNNPNTLAWYICQLTLFIILFEEKKIKVLVTILFGLGFTLLTGSRTMLVISPLIWLIALSLKNIFVYKNIKRAIFYLLIIPVLLILTFYFLNVFKSVFPYASQLLKVLNGGLKSVNSFNQRAIKWSEQINIIRSSWINILFGIRTSNYISMDNDIIYGISRSGIFGLLLQYMFYFIIFCKSIRNLFQRKGLIKYSLFIMLSISFSVLIGLQSDTLTGYQYPVLIIMFTYSINVDQINLTPLKNKNSLENVQILLSVMNRQYDSYEYLKKMNIKDGVLVNNQIEYKSSNKYYTPYNSIEIHTFNEKGVGRSRNHLLLHSTGDICIISDDDMIFHDNYREIVLNEFNKRPEADILIFNIDDDNQRKKTKKDKNITKLNYKKYGAARIVFRRRSVVLNDVFFGMNFGGGTHYGSGEDTIFLKNALDKNLKIIAINKEIARLDETSESTWFKGYNKKFFFDKGALYYYLNPYVFIINAIQFSIRNYKKTEGELSLFQTFRIMVSGASSYKNRKFLDEMEKTF